ncbi:MAG: 4-alpha-glucanotransferase [Pseudoflavonifractor sp.]
MNGRSSGILLPVFSLPGAYGIGSMGAEARSFVDFLAASGQHFWQILPLVPPGDGNSPYMSPSSCAGSPYLIDLDTLVEEGLLTPAEAASARQENLDRVDYAALAEERLPLLKIAFERGKEKYLPHVAALRAEAPWLDEYARFTALRAQLGVPPVDWPSPLPRPDETAVAFELFLQAVFFRQWRALKAYANGQGVSIIGDLPIYVSADSAEFWAHPELFQLDEKGQPSAVAGVPPDSFSATGQHWGNPLYDWAGHRDAVFDWWVARMSWVSLLYDVVRIDHFRAFHTYWSIPAGDTVATGGHWEPGPGMALIQRLQQEVPQLALIAEDLGNLGPEALDFIRHSGLPGMKVLPYAFDPEGESAYLPHNCLPDSIVYTGTHDTPTFVQWLFDEASPAERSFACAYLRLRADEGFGWGAVCGAWSSAARLAIAPMQDLLGLGKDARINAPGTIGPQNWSWRVRSAALNQDVAAHLREITRVYRRGG